MMNDKQKRLARKLLWVLFALFILANVSAAFQAYNFTHFSTAGIAKTRDAVHLSFFDKLKALVVGIHNPRPENTVMPAKPFSIIKLKSNKEKECWYVPVQPSKGTVIIFHGYGGSKSTMLDKSGEFMKMGFSTMLVDFMGSGGSEGNQTTIGYKEAEEVKSCYEYLMGRGERHLILFGTSMGAVAILRAMSRYHLSPSGLILECPFGSMYQTTAARFHAMGVPAFPAAGLLVFWGGIENGFWGFSHNPEEYAKAVKCPSLLMYGEKDDKVSRKETDVIFQNLKGKKRLAIFPLAGHENYLKEYPGEWEAAVESFIKDMANNDASPH